MSSTRGIQFEESMSNTDYGLIVCSKTGKLKGVWIPEGMEESDIPYSIVSACKRLFGIDPNETEYAQTFH